MWCLYAEKGAGTPRERHDMICWEASPRKTRFASLPDMGGSGREDRAFFRAFAGSDPDPAFLLEVFEDR